MSRLVLRDDIFYRYLCHAPLALAMERAAESEIYRRFPVRRPVLDLGCGDGLFAEMLFAERLDTGVDPDSTEIRNARRRERYDELIQTTGDRIPKPDGQYRTILSNSVLEHIPDLRPVLREVHRLLHPGGYFYFTAPSEYFDRYSLGNAILEGFGLIDLSRRYRQFYNVFWKHYHTYSLSGWIDVVTSCGFSVADAFTFNPRINCTLNDTMAPAGFSGVFIKRTTGCWTLWPRLRAWLMKPVARVFHHRIRTSGPCEQGGLVFMALTKSQ